MQSENFRIAFGNYDKSPEHYYLSDDNPLKSTIFLALKLGKPLLITGEPGTGKTQLAYWAAWYLAAQRNENINPFLPQPFVFHTKSSSAGKDLFYNYDAISHFQDKDGKKSIAEFVSLSAMGQAICQTLGRRAVISEHQLAGLRNINSLHEDKRSSVLLNRRLRPANRSRYSRWCG